MRRRPPCRLVVASGLCISIVMLAGGCAGTISASADRSVTAAGAHAGEASHAALVPLVRAAQREDRRPSAEARRLPPPPGIDERLAAPIPDDGRSHLSLGEAVERLAGKPSTRVAEPHRSSDEERQAALRRYLTGRQKLLAGDAAGAVDDLRMATSLDPDSPEPWRELGEAYIAMASRSEAVASFRSAIERGLEDARLLELLGRDALERQDGPAAAAYLARASRAQPEDHDPLLPYVIDVNLAWALAAQGYVTAARDAIVRALHGPAPTAASTRYLQEYGAIFRRQGDLWREVGDAECRLGRFDQALASYRRAAGLPSLDEEAVTARLVFAAMKAGRPAAAALGILEEVIEGGGMVTDAELALLRHVAGVGPDGPRWNSPVRLEAAAALAAYRASLGADVPPSIAASMVRAQAAVLNGPAARSVLREFLTQEFVRRELVLDLVRLCETSADVAREGAALVVARPAAADEVAEAIVQSTVSLSEVHDHLVRNPTSPPRQLLAAHIHAAVGRYADAAEVIASIPEHSAIAATVDAARFTFALGAGQVARWERVANSLRDTASEARLHARALTLAQRHTLALEVLAPFLSGPAAGPRHERLATLLLAAEVAVPSGRVEDAERWLREAAALDRHEDRVYAQLLALHSAGGPRPDATRTAQAVRDMRQHIPESRTGRMLFARELARRNLLPQAESAALALAAESPDLQAVELLTSVWQLRSSRGDAEAIDRGLEWIDAQRARRPLSPALLAGATSLLITANRPEEAAMLLRSAIGDGAGRDAARLLESIMRDALGRRSEADERTLARLSGRPLLPSDALELAEAHLRFGQAPDAAVALHDVIAPDITLVGDQQRRVLAVAGLVAHDAIQSMDAGARRSTIALFDALAARGLTLNPGLHEARLFLLATDPDVDVERLWAAASAFRAQHPSQRWLPVVQTAQTAAQAGRPALALDLLRIANERADRPDESLIGEWLSAVAQMGGPDDARRLIDHIHRNPTLLGPDAAAGADDVDLRSLLAAELAMRAAARGDEDLAIALYELALEYDPDHGWALNNLGYTLLERGDLQRADEMLTRAIALLPDEPPVIDSIGWLRYMQGRLTDEMDPDTGEVITAGAVSLLGRAAATDYGRGSPVILDHYGDALWRAGQVEEAQQQWRAARDLAQQRLNAANNLQRRRPPRRADEAEREPPLTESQQREYREIVRLTRGKLQAVRDGHEPGVAKPGARNPQRPVPEDAPPDRDASADDAAQPRRPVVID